MCATHLYYPILNQSAVIIKNILEGAAINDPGLSDCFCKSCCIIPLDFLTKAVLEGSHATQTIKYYIIFDVVQT